MAALARLLIVVVALAFPGGPAAGADPALRQFAERLAVADTIGFIAAVAAVRANGRLPQHYLTKDQAAALGWRPGEDLCRAAPGRSLGGDRFANRERRLPEAAGRRWREADLDYACGKRGGKRLVWSNDGLLFVTVDHYRTFHKVPDGPP
ncbi:MAG: ribonuclease domain-containing protein [Pseudomonadota bacterium]